MINKSFKKILMTALMFGGLISTAGSNSVKRPSPEEQFVRDFSNSLDSLADYTVKLKTTKHEKLQLDK